MKKIPGHFIDLIQAACQPFPFDFLSRLLDFRQGDMSPLGQHRHGVGKGNVLLHHNEFKYVARGMTAETIKKTFVSGDAERRCFFTVKRTAGPEIPSLALQGHIP